MGFRGNMGPFHGEQGRYWSCSMGTEEIWAIFLGNKGDKGPVHGVQGRYVSCTWQSGEVWDLVKIVEQGKDCWRILGRRLNTFYTYYDYKNTFTVFSDSPKE